MKKTLTLVFMFSFIVLSGVMAQKKPLDPSVYDSWKTVTSAILSDDGQWSIFVVAPQEGDAVLNIYDNKSSKTTTFERGSSPTLFANGTWVSFNIKKPLLLERKYEVEKTAKGKQQKDSTIIIRLSDMTTKTLVGINSFRTSPKGDLAAWFEEYAPVKPDAKKQEEKSAEKNNEKTKAPAIKPVKTNKLFIFDASTQLTTTIDSVASFQIAKNGKSILYDKIENNQRIVYSGLVTSKGIDSNRLANIGLGKTRNFAISEDGKNLAFAATKDTTKTALYDLYFGDAKAVNVVVAATDPKMPKNFNLAAGGVSFLEDGRLNFGIKQIEKIYKDVKKTKAETFTFDLWSYHDTLLQTQQMGASKQSLENYSYRCLFNPKTKSWIRLTDINQSRISMPSEAASPYALLSDSYAYAWWSTIDSPTGTDYYLVDLKTGGKEKIFTRHLGRVMMSPNAKYLLNYDVEQQAWYSYNVATKQNVKIAADIPNPLYNELQDTPTYPSPYGLSGWTEGDKRVLILDKFDVWSVDPTGVAPSVNITKTGRKTNKTFRLMSLDREEKFVNLKKPLLLSSFDILTRDQGVYSVDVNSEPVKLVESANVYSLKAKANKTDDILFTREAYTEVPDLWKSTTTFKDSKKITDINPQMKDYLWGSSQLTSWTDFNGDKVEGLLLLPEGYSKDKTYPTIVYFYERYTENLNKFHMPQPSWSIIIPSYCTSNGYVVLIPDIKYETGYPGKSSYDAIVSGTMALIERGIANKEKIALQGQSWGGYATSYLVTQTNLYACAAPGAPVSNMTSAYGGIRWESGMARSFQYEHGQSRIGATPWERRDLYIDNSPLFFADRVNTPLFIRHDDADEAVPWYQGIEFYIALRRLGKPVWMINYNNEPHNLKNRYARKDFSERLYQFLDYYLKDTDMPRWMKEGIPYSQKNKEFKLDLIKE